MSDDTRGSGSLPDVRRCGPARTHAWSLAVCTWTASSPSRRRPRKRTYWEIGTARYPPAGRRASGAGSGRARLLRQAEHPLADDLALDLGGASPDRLRAGEEERGL